MKPTGLWVALLLGAVRLGAQGVVIAPHAVFIDARTRSGAVLLYNPNTEPVEVAISFFFGYPATDSAGSIVVRTVEHPDSTSPSAAGWIQAFPRRLTVPPLERQTIRLLASPPPGLADGEYWARLTQQGNAAYIGSARAVLVDSAGKTVSEIKVPIGVYYAMEPRYALPIGALAPGRYRLRLDLSTGREDLAPELVLSSPPVRDSAEVRVP